MAEKQHTTRSAVWLTLRTLPKVSQPLMIALSFLTVATSGINVASTAVSGSLVGSVPAAIRAGLGSAESAHMFHLVAAIALLGVFAAIAGAIHGIVMEAMQMKFGLFVHRRIMAASLGPAGVAHLEDPVFYDEFTLAQGSPGPNGVLQVFFIANGVFTAIGAAVLLAKYVWWAPLVLAIGVALQVRWVSREVENLHKPWVNAATDIRRGRYFRDLALQSAPAKEVRVFGLARWVLDRFHQSWLIGMGEVWKARRTLSRALMLAVVATLVCAGAVYVGITWMALGGALTLTGVAISLQAAGSLGEVGWSGQIQYMVRLSAKSLEHLLGLEHAITKTPAQLTGARTDMTGLPRQHVTFENLSFSYPGADRKVFDGLTLRIPSGVSTAIVGANGAGKTTLMKLLCRLYDPDDGRVAVDGIDLRELDPAAWRKRLGVVFQDFVQYALPARDNVAFGAIEYATDLQAIAKAAREAGAEDFINELPSGWDTVLSREFTGGGELSGGQWQRVALARALFAAQRGGVLILDEPTANMDVRAEAELFERFLELTRGLTTILISHRFSSVRRADHICVLEHGVLVEEGSHDVLMAKRGRYSEMFLLQAQRFLADEVSADG